MNNLATYGADLVGVVESTLYRDLRSLYAIRNPKVLFDVLILLSEKLGAPVSFATLGKQLKIDDGTAKKLIDYLMAIQLIFVIPVYTKSTKVALRNPSKYYFTDHGIAGVLSKHFSEGSIAENIVARRLLSIKTSLLDNPTYTYTYVDGAEVDFKTKDQMYEVKYRDDWEEIIANGGQLAEIKYIVKGQGKNGLPAIGLERFLS